MWVGKRQQIALLIKTCKMDRVHTYVEVSLSHKTVTTIQWTEVGSATFGRMKLVQTFLHTKLAITYSCVFDLA
jgi:hypothetical protein